MNKDIPLGIVLALEANRSSIAKNGPPIGITATHEMTALPDDAILFDASTIGWAKKKMIPVPKQSCSEDMKRLFYIRLRNAMANDLNE